MSLLALAKQWEAKNRKRGCGSSSASRAVDYARLYRTLTATFGTADDLAAFSYLYDHGCRDLPAELARLEGDCGRLAQAQAPEPEFRAAVERLVDLVRWVRVEYQAARREEGNP